MGDPLPLSVRLATWACSGAPPAYVDPGAGSIALQLLLGGLTSAALLVRALWGRLRRRRWRSDADRTALAQDDTRH